MLSIWCWSSRQTHFYFKSALCRCIWFSLSVLVLINFMQVQAHGADAMVEEENCVFFLPHRPRSQICEPPFFLFMKGTGNWAISLCYTPLLPMYKHLCSDWFSFNHLWWISISHESFGFNCTTIVHSFLSFSLAKHCSFTCRLVWRWSWSLWALDRPSFFVCFPGEGCNGTLRIFVLQFCGLEFE